MNYPFSAFITRDRNALLLLALYTLMLLVLPHLLTPPSFARVFSETGPFEIGAIVCWLAVAALLAAGARGNGRGWLAWIFLCVAFGLREADAHKFFTAGSILKLNYYRNADVAVLERLLAAAVASLFILLLLYAAYTLLRFLRTTGAWRSASGKWLLGASALLVATKLVDRMPAVFAENGILLPPLLLAHSLALEEGLEMVLPLLAGRGMWLGRGQGPFRPREHDHQACRP